MKNASINSKEDGVTKDMVPQEKGSSAEYHFPSLGVSVQATSYSEALEKAKKEFKNKNK